jgi:hypothetical protein
VHGGGRRCQEDGCYKGAVRQHASLQGARRGQALPDGGLLQVRSRRHGALHRARRGQAVPDGRLHQGAVSPARAARRCVGRCSATASQVPGARATGGETSTGGGWRVRGHPRASDRSDVQDVYNIERRRTPQHRLRRNCHGVSTLLKAIEESLASTVDIGVPPRPLL